MSASKIFYIDIDLNDNKLNNTTIGPSNGLSSTSGIGAFGYDNGLLKYRDTTDIQIIASKNYVDQSVSASTAGFANNAANSFLLQGQSVAQIQAGVIIPAQSGTSGWALNSANSFLLNNQNDNFYLNRTNQTGTQLANTISNFNAAVDARIPAQSGTSGWALNAAYAFNSNFASTSGYANDSAKLNGLTAAQITAGSWSLLGNANTVDGTNFIGTTDNIPLNFRAFNQKAGRIETTSQANTFFGYQSGNVSNNNLSNTGIGYRSLFSNTTGGQNTAYGSQSLSNNITGSFNTSNGFHSLRNNTTGNENTAYGAGTLLNNTTGVNNTAVGSYTLTFNTTGSSNTAIGAQALNNNTTGSSNTTIGQRSLFSNTTGSNNTSFGSQALFNNTTGTSNIAFGYQSLLNNTTGTFNTAIGGLQSLILNTTGSFNTAIGAQTLANNTTGADNTTNGARSLLNNTTGNSNTAFGHQALFNNTTGNSNTAIGSGADVSTGNLTNATAIGNGALVSASNTMQLGNSSVTQVNIGIGNNATLVTGGLRVVGGTLAAGQILTSDASGNATWQVAAGGGDMVLASVQTNTGAKTFLNNTLLLRNVANTFNGSFTNTNLADRTYTLKDANGTIAFTSDITGVNSGTNSGDNATNTQYSGLVSNATHTGDATGATALTVVRINGVALSGLATGILRNTTGTGEPSIAVNSDLPVMSATVGGAVPTPPNNTTTFLRGDGTFATPAGGGGGWSLLGNDLTVDGTDFIGTLDDIPLNFRANNQKAGRVETTTQANTYFGYQAGDVSNNDLANTAIGYQSLLSNTSGYYNSANGLQALQNNTTGFGNTAIGFQSLLSNTTGTFNSANGYQSLLSNTTGDYNSANGYQSLYSNTIGSQNTAYGIGSLFTNTTGSYNNANGSESLLSNTTGDYNTANGYQSLLSNTTGSNNTGLGNGADVSGNLNNATAIGNGAIVDASNTMQLGNAAVTQVNIGVGTAATLLTGGLRVVGGTLGVGRILTSDASGNATWQVGGWALTGNDLTVDGTDFIGTLDDIPLNFRANNQKAGRVETTTQANTYFGYQAGDVSNNDLANTGIGYQSLFSNTTGFSNTANGARSLYSNTTGDDNTAIGVESLSNNTTGSSNTAIGRNSLGNNTTGGDNTANGLGSLQNNTIGNFNTAIGSSSLLSNTVGNYNTANGAASLLFNTIGNNNNANGFESLSNNTTGNNNNANGYQSLFTNTTGDFNSANGAESLFSNDTGSNNTANGYQSLQSNINGSQNTANGASSLQSNITGSQNTAIGLNALIDNTTGNENTAIGNGANVAAGNLNNATAIGNGAIVDASNTMQLGNADVTLVNIGVGTVATLVTGGLRVVGGTLAAGQILTSDASGNATWQVAAGGGDMVLASVQTNTGAKTFLNNTLLLRNVANTFNGSFTNTNLADRTYTLKDANGTIAFTSDITGVNSGTNTGDQTITLTGGVTGSGTGSFAATVVTNANLTGVVTSLGNATSIANGAITNAMLANGAVANLTNTNSGDNAVNTLYSGLVSNATHTGDATGATALTLATVNSNVGSFGSTTLVPVITVNGKGLITAVTTATIPVYTLAGLGGIGLTSLSFSAGSGAYNNTTGVITIPTNNNQITNGAGYLTANQAITLTATGDATGTSSASATAPSIALTVARINGVALSGLATGILRNTTGTGVPSIAINSDLPVMSATVGGAVPTPPNNTTTFLRGDGTFATPAGGGGITNTAANNEIMKSDGTNAVPSGLFSTTAGDLTLGTGLAGASRTLDATGSATDVGLILATKGAGELSTPAITNLGTASISGGRTLKALSSDASSTIVLIPKGSGVLQILSDLYLGSSGFAGASRNIFAASSATNVNIILIPKGSGAVQVLSDLYLGSSGFAGASRNIFAESSATNVNLILIPKGTGVTEIQSNVTVTGVDRSVLLDAVTAEPSTPGAGQLHIYAKDINGFQGLKIKGLSGLDTPLQPAIYQNSIWLVTPNSSSSYSAVGGAVTSGGTISHPTPSVTSFGYCTNQITGTIAGNAAGTGHNLAPYNGGSSVIANGGYKFVSRLWWPDADYGSGATGSRFFIGLTNQTMGASVGSDNPTGHRAGFALSTNLSETDFMLTTKNGTTETRVSTGVAFVVRNLYDFYITLLPGGTEIFWRIDNLSTGVVTKGSTTSTLPTSTVYMRAGFQIVTLQNVARNIRMKKIYVETDN
jgi:hypothetical protein